MDPDDVFTNEDDPVELVEGFDSLDENADCGVTVPEMREDGDCGVTTREMRELPPDRA